ncbi:hypothetical protein Enr17x_45860 [Gimesia fumaroli]|uniref:Lipoprotein n=2 Tax=Gimesia fumaroli TaxID=2527976 RepID=A0A518IHF5_9PLAN|nr:hypothetical protein Enr17x_45860 [Gimesia fumaroli]
MKKSVDKISSSLSLCLICYMTIFSTSGCTDPSEIAKEQDAKHEKQPQDQAAAPEQPAAMEMPQEEAAIENKNAGKKSILQRTTAVVVDAKKALKNPEIVIVDGKIKGVDPYSQAGSAYVSMASRVSTLGMQQAIKTYKVLNERFPTYDEYMKMMKENRIEFAQLPPYKMYGYNDETGNILVLQDNKKKAELYKDAGIPLD